MNVRDELERCYGDARRQTVRRGRNEHFVTWLLWHSAVHAAREARLRRSDYVNMIARALDAREQSNH